MSNDLSFDQRMIRICTTLSQAGFEVVLVGRVLPNSVALSDRPFSQKRLKLFFESGKLFYLELNLRLFLLLLWAKFDIVYAVDLDTLPAGRVASLLRQKACVYDAHEYFTEVPELIDRPFSKKVWEIVARLLIPGLKHAITVCQSLAEVFEEKYGVKFEVIRNVPFASTDQPLRIPNKGKFTLLYQGALNDGRGLEEAIAAMALLDGVALWICGEGDLSASLRQQVVDGRLEEKVKFWGKLKPEELVRITGKADLGLNLLKNKGLNYYYSLANKAFDYIQAGLPSIGMAFPEYQRLNEQAEVFCLIEALDAQKIALAVNRFRTENQYYQRVTENCIRMAKELNWELESQKLLDLFAKI